MIKMISLWVIRIIWFLNAALLAGIVYVNTVMFSDNAWMVLCGAITTVAGVTACLIMSEVCYKNAPESSYLSTRDYVVSGLIVLAIQIILYLRW